MKTWLARSFDAPRVLLFLLLSAGCRHTPNGQQVFLQSEAALDAVRSFSMHIENRGEPYWADAEFACDQDIMRYVTVQGIANSPSLKTEHIQTANYTFTRTLEPEAGGWGRSRKPIDPGVCGRLKSPSIQALPANRYITVDRAGSLPPLFAFANEQGATITHERDELCDGLPCEVWTIRHGVADLARPETVWISVADRLPRRYVEGELDHPISVVTYAEYGQPFHIQLPPSDGGY